jgi:bifunctional DNase/RNase
MAEGLVEMFVESVRLHMLSNRHVVILKEPDRERYLPIWIGSWEASAIAMRLQGLTPERPLTHDLFASALRELGVRVQRVIISALAEETFHARLIFELDGRLMELDSRPSDALALAVRTDAPIFAAEGVLARAALGADSAMLQGEDDVGSVLETTGGAAADPRLDVFRDFINSLDLDLGGGQGRPPSRTD